MIIEANSACCQLFGYTERELIGQTLSNQVQFSDLKAFDEFIEKAKSGTQLQGQFRCLTSKKGVTFHSQILVTTLTYQTQPYFLFVIRDITQQIEAYQLLEQRVFDRTSELSTLLEISQQIVATLDIKVLENILLNQLKRLVNYSGVILFTHDQNNLKLLFKYLPVSEADAKLLVSHLEHSAVTNLVLKERKPVIISDVRGD
jgi:PAS domain S-box-containing protein